MSIVSGIYDIIIGVDTHAATHTLVAVKANTGAILDQATFPTSSAGINRSLGWVERRTNSPELDETWGYPLTLAAMATSCLLLLRIFKRYKWL